MAPRTAGPLRRALGAPFRRSRATGVELTPVPEKTDKESRKPAPDLSRSAPPADAGTPDLLGDLDRRLDAARTRLRDAIPPPAE